MSDNATERSRLTRLVQDAVARGQAALAAGDRMEATRWLDRAHRLAPADGTVTLFLASAMIGDDNQKAAALFARVLDSHDVRDAWLGLATARFLMGELAAVCAALTQVLGRHALRPEAAELAHQVARATGAPGWCGLTSEGVLVVHPVGEGQIDIRVDGKPLYGVGLAGQQMDRDTSGKETPVLSKRHPLDEPKDDTGPGHDDTGNRLQTTMALPPSWPRARSITVLAEGNRDRDRHLIGSPLSPAAIGRVEGFVEAGEGGLRGWVWCSGDPDTDPRLSVGIGRTWRNIVATKAANDISGLPPLARPRAFAIRWAELPDANTGVRLRGRDGRDLRGSPVIARRRDFESTPSSKGRGRPTSGVLSPPLAAGETDPSETTGRRLGLGRWRDKGTGAVILVTHDDGGGVERRIQASVAAHAAKGYRAIVLRPMNLPDEAVGVVADAAGLPAMRFELPRERSALLRLLRAAKPIEVELHHFLNHDPSVFQIIRELGVPYDAHTHDYAWFCPRIALVGQGDRYCGEPEPAACQACIEKLGGFLHEDIRVTALLDRSRGMLSGARRIIAPSRDAAARMERHFPGLAAVIIPHEDDEALDEPPPIPTVTGTVRVCVAGAIGLHKGFHVLLACARDARKRGLDITFVVAGTTIDDQRLINTGRVFVTGPYQPDEAADLIRAQNAALALFPSIWPETWCLGLTELWRAGLRVAAFDIGAPAERIRRTGRGFLLPLGLSPSRINDALLNAARGRSFLPIRRSSAYKPSH